MCECRDDFPMLKTGVTYLDSAATAFTPTPVIETIRRFYAEEYGTVHRAIYKLAAHSTERYNEAREKVADLLNARSSDEIIFTKGTTESLNLVAASLGKALIDMGDEIVISESEHHANIVPWQMLCEERGATLHVLPVDDQGAIILEAAEHLFSTKTKIVSIGHISNSLGTINPIKEIVAIAREMGALIVVDGAQAVPHMPVDVQDLDVDFYAFSGHKLYGPTGIGVLYGKRELLENLPPYQGGGDMIERVTFEETTYGQLPVRFEAGTPNIAGVLGLGSAVDYVQSLGLEEIHKHGQDLLSYATTRLAEVDGLQIIGQAPDKGPIISFVVEGCHPLDVGTLLDLENICVRTGHHCAQPTMDRFGVEATTRASFAPYNTRSDIDHLVTSLQQILPKLHC